MRVCLFEDRSGVLEPLTWTRPVFDLLCGLNSLGSKQYRFFSPCQAGVLVRPYLADWYRLQHPGTMVNDLDWLRSGSAILVNGRWLPPQGRAEVAAAPCLGLVEEEVAYAVVDQDHLRHFSLDTLEDCLATWRKVLPCTAAGGRLIRYPWELVERNPQQLIDDFACLGRSSLPPPGLALVGPAERLLIDPSAYLDPLVVVDTRLGPVMIDHEAVVLAFTRLEGPCYVGPGTRLFRAHVRGGTTLGPQCRSGGEIEASIVHGYSNKYHDGFLGHSYVGEWVNFGAGTSCSDLRNDYGPVRVIIAGQAIDTGLTKVGCFLGDHTRTGLGTLLNTGTTVGIFCNLLPSAHFVPKYVPSFLSWLKGSWQSQADWQKVLATADTVMRRRGQALSQSHVAVYRHVHSETWAERQRVLGTAETGQRRRSA